MVEVYIWEAAKVDGGKNVGHASMQVQRAYVSWWPEGDIWQSSPHRNRSFEADCRAEGSRPHHTVAVSGLDEVAIQKWWAGLGLVSPSGQSLSGPLLPYALTTRNCSTVVVEGLRAGGADARIPWWTRMYWVPTIWRPSTVLSYAMDLTATSKK